jgi:hypothetical protein
MPGSKERRLPTGLESQDRSEEKRIKAIYLIALAPVAEYIADIFNPRNPMTVRT